MRLSHDNRPSAPNTKLAVNANMSLPPKSCCKMYCFYLLYDAAFQLNSIV